MKLIIAEKPELGRDIAKAILHSTKECNGIIANSEYSVTWAYGHLLELQEPEVYDEKYKNWCEQDLPIYFENWKKVPAQDIQDKHGRIIIDNKYKRLRLNLIGDLLKKTDYVIHAGDPDEEGQNLIDEILEYFNFKGTVKRVFVNDNIEKNIIKEFDRMQDNHTQLSVSNSVYARQMTDKCHGINHSRLASIRLKQAGLSIGRVQTATLGLVVNRDEAIINHVKEKYFDLEVLCDLENTSNQYEGLKFKFKPSDDFLAETKRITDKETLHSIKNDLKDTYECSTDVKEKIIAAPLPYNQTLLSADMNRLYGYSLKKTLDITQALRDKHKAITYNRSDSQYLKREHFYQAPIVTKQVMANLEKEYPVAFESMSKCFNDEFAPAHHGIIPQERIINLSALSVEERNVYIAISERYLMQFLPAQEINVSTTIFDIKDGAFIHISSLIINNGWKEYFSIDNSNDSDDSSGTYIKEGKYRASILSGDILSRETKPLKNYSEGSLVKDMTSISKYVSDPVLKQALKDKDKGKKGENGSIGTVATRGTIIEKLLKNKLLKKEGKHIVSTELGREFYHLIPDKIKTADITAKWWIIQESIKSGERNVNELMLEDVNEYLAIKDIAYQNTNLKSEQIKKEMIGVCPICNSPIYEGKNEKGKSWYCSAYKIGCNFRLYENTKRFNDTVKLTTAKVKKILAGGKIENTLTNKEGKVYQAYLKINIRNGYVNFDIDGFVDKKK